MDKIHDFTPADPEEFAEEEEYERDRDHLTDAAWAAGELQIHIYEDR
jgi:hypothetical protein